MSGGATTDPGGSGAARPTVDIRGLCKSFGSNDVLKGVDFHVDQREVVVVLGPSGSGKSTLLRCVNLLETPDSGQVLIDGIDICDEDTDVNAVRRRIGMVFQQFNLFAHLSALDNVTIAQRKVLKRSAAEAQAVARRNLERVGVGDKAGHFPAQLSGGQQQRVAIARALAMDPPLLLLDEPTASIDPARRSSLGDVLDALCQAGRTLLIATHDDDFVRNYADRVVRLADGCVIEEGEPEVVLRRPSRISARSAQRLSGRRNAL